MTMRLLLLGYLILPLLFSPIAFSAQSQLVAQEIKLRESSAEFYQDLINTIPFELTFNNEVEFSRLAQEQGFTEDDLKERLQWLARVYLEPRVGVDNAISKAAQLIASLTNIANTPFDKSYILMLKARKVGREKQDYQQSIELYNQSLKQLNDAEDIATTLLLHTIHYQLGDVYRITLHKSQALVHFNQYRELAYQLREGYLIAQAEATLGLFFNRDEQYTKALQHYIEAIRVSEGLDKPFLQSVLTLRLARVYRDLESWDESLEYAHKAADGFKALNNDNYLSSCMTVIAMVYANQGKWNQAIDYYLNAQQIDVKRGNLTAQALNFHNLGEAYFNNAEPKTALDFLIKANSLFLQKKSKHYLVYNDILIAQVATELADWSMVNAYGAKGFLLAKEQNLLSEMIEALQYRTLALKHLGEIEKALATLDELLIYSRELAEQPKDDQAYNPSLLAEQKLKLQLNQLQGAKSDSDDSLQQFRLLFIITLLLATLISLVCINQWRSKRFLGKKSRVLVAESLLDPVTKLPGYRGFIDDIGAATQSPMIAMMSLTGAQNSDLLLGQQQNNQQMQQLIDALTDTLAQNAYIIRPGLIAMTFSKQQDHQQTLDTIRVIVNQLAPHADISLHLGIINLPLLSNLDVKLSSEVHFGVLQMMVAGAISLGHSNDYYVTITPLNFAPAAIFSTPLYLHLEKAISRGLVKVECNDNKALIRWPKWQGVEES